MKHGSQSTRRPPRPAFRVVPVRIKRASSLAGSASVQSTGKAKNDESLSNERTLYKDLTSTLPVGTYRIRVKAARVWVHHEWITRLGTNYSFDLVNDQFCRTLGVTRRQCKEDVTIVAKRIHPDDRQDFIARNIEALNSPATFRWAGRIVRGKEVRWVSFVSVPRLLSSGDMLWTGVLQDTTENRRVADYLRKANEELDAAVSERTAQLRALAVELTETEHRERRRIAHILHEDLQQRLVGIQFKLHSLKESGSTPSLAQKLDASIQELAGAIHLARDLAVQISPPILSALGFRAALDWLAKEAQTTCGLEVAVTGCKSFKLSSAGVQAFAFDAVRELLLNVCKHAGVHSARIHSRLAGKHQLAVVVSDSGKGGAVIHKVQSSFGLLSIRERASALGIGFELDSPRGKGTCVMLILPTRESAGP